MGNLVLRHVAIGLLLALLLSGCGAGRTTILERPTMSIEATGIDILMEDPLTPMPEDLIARFARAMNAAFLDEKTGFVRGSDLKIRWRVVQFEAGSRFARWLTAGIGNAGEASMTAEVRFLTPDDIQVARIHVEGRLGSGFFGGSIDSALEKAAEEAADYAQANFR